MGMFIADEIRAAAEVAQSSTPPTNAMVCVPAPQISSGCSSWRREIFAVIYIETNQTNTQWYMSDTTLDHVDKEEKTDPNMDVSCLEEKKRGRSESWDASELKRNQYLIGQTKHCKHVIEEYLLSQCSGICAMSNVALLGKNPVS